MDCETVNNATEIKVLEDNINKLLEMDKTLNAMRGDLIKLEEKYVYAMHNYVYRVKSFKNTFNYFHEENEKFILENDKMETTDIKNFLETMDIRFENLRNAEKYMEECEYIMCKTGKKVEDKKRDIEVITRQKKNYDKIEEEKKSICFKFLCEELDDDRWEDDDENEKFETIKICKLIFIEGENRTENMLRKYKKTKNGVKFDWDSGLLKFETVQNFIKTIKKGENAELMLNMYDIDSQNVMEKRAFIVENKNLTVDIYIGNQRITVKKENINVEEFVEMMEAFLEWMRI